MTLNRVNGKIVYHIHNADWEVGETYQIGETDNSFLKDIPFTKNYNDLKARSDELRRLLRTGSIIDWPFENSIGIYCLGSIIEQLGDPSLIEDTLAKLTDHIVHLEELQKKLKKDNPPGLDDIIIEYMNLVGILRNYLLLVREYVFEDVRRNSFSELPSRQKCLWVIEDNGNINESIKFWWNELNRRGKLLKLEVNGDLFQSDEKYLQLTLEPIESLKLKAKSYWQGVLGSDPTYYECLFVGDAKVLEVVRRNYEEFEVQRIDA